MTGLSPKLARAALFTMALPAALTGQPRASTLSRELDAIIAQAVRETHFMGTVVVGDASRVLYQRQAGLADAAFNIPNGPQTRFRIASVTKQFTALLVMQLVDAGTLRLEAPVATYLPWFTADTARLITLEHLLTHMSGVRDLESVPAYYDTDDSTLATHADVVKRHLMVAPEWQPGTRFRYNNADFIMLGAVLEQVTGRSYATLLQQRILTPLRLTGTGLVREQDIIANLAAGYDADADGRTINAPAPVQRFMASGAMYSTAADMLTWNRALARHTLLSPAATERMFRPNAYGGALGSWQYDWSSAADSALASAQRPTVRVIERQGWINTFRALSVRLPERGLSVVVIANGGSTDLSTLSRGTGVASAIIGAVERSSRRAPRVARTGPA